ncbi:MAG: hypothetical protein ABEI99_05810 [Halobaculum sp.]
MQSKSGLNRRKVLQVSGTVAGAATVPGTAAALADTTSVTTVSFTKVGVFHDVPDASGLPHVDPMGLTTVDEDTDTLYVLNDDPELRRRFERNDRIVDGGGFESLPTTLYEGRKTTEIPVDRLGYMPRTFLPTDEPYSFPAVRVQHQDNRSVSVSSGSKQTTVGIGEGAELTLPTRSVSVPDHVAERTEQGDGSQAVTPKVRASNFGELTVKMPE